MEDYPLWFKVLCHFDDNNYFENGLTIPFLLGASSIINSSDAILSVEEFFLQAIDDSLPRKISLQKCGYIGEYVIGTIDKETINYPYGKAIAKQFGNISITDDSFLEILDSNEVKKILIDESQNLLDSNLYSINQGEWGNYSDIESSRIKELE
ncbi:hypothetical protein QLS91_16585 [Flavobacterium sp. LB2P84]|uniref:DUF4240 domain-containing protein n=1 Tax=Flavobacterium yafengii TaxID=3041253 RepID=A0AAW6TRD3_9FLAO|nr:hypothetical protein [Flavobacterium yafengii]MDI5950213.1 hypothetical protein [Flavobacterium yafengii]MDI6034698.1 hypothetical protein [Flavobacterium yafengii]